MPEQELLQELQRLKAALEQVEQRLSRLERAGEAPPPPAPPPPAEDQTEEEKNGSYSRVFTGLALACFVLLGALVLRVATQEGLLAAVPGTCLGLAYCAILLVAPRLLRQISFFANHGAVMQYCGAILAPPIALETFHKNQVLSAGAAAGVLLLTGVLGALMGAFSQRRALAAVSLAAAITALAALGLTTEAAAFRGASVVALAGLGLSLAHWKSWPALRPLTLTPGLAALGFAVLLTARRPEVPPEIALAFLLCALALWLLAGLNHVLRWTALKGPEAAWLPLLSVWAGGLAYFYAPSVTPWGAAGVAVAALFAAWRLSRTHAETKPALLGLVAASALSAALFLPALDNTGLSLGVFALALAGLNRRRQSNFAAVLSQGQVLLATVAALSLGGMLMAPGSSTAGRVLLGLILAALLAGHYWLTGGPQPSPGPSAARWLAPLSLVGGAVMLFCSLRLAAGHLLGEGEPFLFAQTVLLAVLSAGTQVLGRRWRDRALSGLGLAGLLLLSAKVFFWDLFALSGLLLLGAVITVGLSYVVTSLVSRRRAAPPS